MGTPDFAEKCLDALLEDEFFQFAGVVTKPDTRSGRGMKLNFSDVKKRALEKNIPVYQPETLKDGAIKPLLDEIKPDCIVVAAYGKILPGYVIDYPKYGCINVHGSLLPEYRGASPIQRAVLDGKKETGVTTMFMERGLDTGDILFSEKTEIGENETTGELFDKLAEIGGKLLVKTLHALENGSVNPIKQDGEKATYAEKITESECALDFSKKACDVHNKIRGLSPFPGAEALLDGKRIKLYGSALCKEDGYENASFGEAVAADKNGIKIKCLDGLVSVSKFKPEGKGVLSALDMINGRKISVGKIFEKREELL